ARSVRTAPGTRWVVANSGLSLRAARRQPHGQLNLQSPRRGVGSNFMERRGGFFFSFVVTASPWRFIGVQSAVSRAVRQPCRYDRDVIITNASKPALRDHLRLATTCLHMYG